MAGNGSGADEFTPWVAAEFDRAGPFTALVVLVAIAERSVSPLCSTYLNVIGAEVDWDEMAALLAGSGMAWEGAAFFPVRADGGGPLTNVLARVRLREVEEAVRTDRLELNKGQLFDRLGRRLLVEEADEVGGHA